MSDSLTSRLKQALSEKLADSLARIHCGEKLNVNDLRWIRAVPFPPGARQRRSRPLVGALEPVAPQITWNAGLADVSIDVTY